MKTKQVGRYKVDEFSYNCESEICSENKVITFSIQSIFDNSIYSSFVVAQYVFL